MFIISKLSRKKLIHNDSCHYVKRIEEANRLYFNTREEAISEGGTPCYYCSLVINAYKKEKTSIDSFCAKYKLQLRLDHGIIRINDGLDKWIFISLSAKKKIYLYHKNRYRNKNQQPSKSILANYHRQKIHFSSLLQALESIYDHFYSFVNKQHDEKASNIAKYHIYNNTQHNKSQKRKQKETKANKLRQDRYSIKRVLDLIDSLQANNKENT